MNPSPANTPTFDSSTQIDCDFSSENFDSVCSGIAESTPEFFRLVFSLNGRDAQQQAYIKRILLFQAEHDNWSLIRRAVELPLETLRCILDTCAALGITKQVLEGTKENAQFGGCIKASINCHFETCCNCAAARDYDLDYEEGVTYIPRVINRASFKLLLDAFAQHTTDVKTAIYISN